MRNVVQAILSSLRSRFNKPEIKLQLSLGALVVLGFVYMQNIWTITMNETPYQVLNEVQPYQQIKSTLIKFENEDPDVCYVYLYAQKEGEVYRIIVDSKPSK